MRLYLFVEGPTEERLVKAVVAPHLASRSIWATPFKVNPSRDPKTGQRRGTGGGHWKIWRKDIDRFRRQHRGRDVRFTTLFDLYHLPDDFPELGEHVSDRDTLRRVAALEEAMAKVIDDDRFIPYLQRHEIEALVLVGLNELGRLLDAVDDKQGLEALQKWVAAIPPEDVDDGEATAPSKLLMSAIPSYQKTLHGPLVAEQVGLARLRAKCPRFDRWIAKLEALPPSG